MRGSAYRNRYIDGEGLGLGVSPSDIAPTASCHVSSKNCGNCLLIEKCDPERPSARIYSFCEQLDIEGVLFIYNDFAL